jgi:hypothetical protein
MNQDLEHLRLLSIFHYVVAGLMALFACFPLIYLVFGLVMLIAPVAFQHAPNGPHGQHGGPNDAAVLQFMGLIFVCAAVLFTAIGWAFAACIFMAARFLGQQRYYTFCLVMAALLCLNSPFGTVLGVFTIVVLMRPSVKLLFQPQPVQPPFRPSA